jgi:hypothetical protein
MKKFLFLFIMILSLGIFTACNNDDQKSAPRYSNVAILASTDEASKISILVNTVDSEAMIYYIIVDKDAAKPTKEQVKAGVNYSDVTVHLAGSQKQTLYTGVTLEEGMPYEVYVVLEHEGVFSEIMYSTQVVTKTAAEVIDRGQGTEEEPFLIRTVADLEEMLTGEKFVRDAHYKLMNDLDLAEAGYGADGKSWTPIGKQTGNIVRFAGSLDGDGHTIKNLYMHTDEATEKWGLFAEVEPTGMIKNLTLTDVDINVKGKRVGAVIGYSKGSIFNVSVIGGTIVGAASGDGDVGGIVGYQYQSGTISRAYSNVNISSGGRRLGGITGVAEVAVSDKVAIEITDSYFTGTITGTSPDARQIGGITGWARGVVINRCYSTGNITGTKEIGGLVGFIEQRSGSPIVPAVKNSFYMGAEVKSTDETTSLVSNMIGNYKTTYGTPQVENLYAASTTTITGGTAGDSTFQGEVVTSDNFKSETWIKDTLDWNFDAIWEIKEGASRPTLKNGMDDGSFSLPEVPTNE